ncbi:uncharacterized protein N7443_000792 [Penicillium atrosanguineum]|uniref:uncharacterized protein n=1 Tax=Penicillium atrosanguineum TaxID=1132637 RepID=UPI00239AD400|nr:uncharacterized protein N7443_000792 [Penicillium atrosanguineum]KAJ5313908.1 hypothetical protein N7443_000792 [Penicillium atrosanguineum]
MIQKNRNVAVTPPNENAPVLSLFDNGVLGFRRSDASPPNITLYSSTSRDWEKIRYDLLALLPSQSTLERLGEANSCWWLVRAQCFKDYEKSLLSSSRVALSDFHPAMTAKALLWVAICLQQLPRGFDVDSLELGCSPNGLIAKCINIVAMSISSDETLIMNIDGLECLVLQGIFYNNDGKLRSAWLSYRRALNVAQIIGLHRLAPEAAQDSESTSRARHIWNHIIYADRYLSLMLGMYHGITDVALDSQCGLSEKPNTSMDLLCCIAGSIIERNQRLTQVTPAMAFTAAVTLMINLLGPKGRPRSSSDDWLAVEGVMAILEKLAEGQPPDKVATRGLVVLQTLKDVARGNKPTQIGAPEGLSTDDKEPGRIKIDIPYFGTISLVCGMRSDPSEQQEPDNVPPHPLLFDTGIAVNTAPSSQMGIIPELSTTQVQFTDIVHWPETRLEIGPNDIWTFGTGLAASPPFLPDFGDDWDLGF